MSISKCPKCEKAITHMNANPMPAKDGTQSVKGAVYTCPYCYTILGAGADPYALAEEVARRTAIALKSR